MSAFRGKADKALSSPVPAYLGSRRNAELLAMWGSENIGGPCDRNRFIHPTPRPLGRIRAFGRNCRPWYRRCSVTSLAFKWVFWRPGLIVTADEALSEEGDVAVTLADGESIEARLVGRDHTTDIAVLRVDRS